MSENIARNKNIAKENKNVNWPDFDFNEKNGPVNRLYVSELPENAIPGISQRRDESQELILKFDWYFSTSESEIQSKVFSVPKSGKFCLKARSSPWKEHGKHVQVSLLMATADNRKNVALKITAILRSPDWKIVEEQRGHNNFTDSCKSLDLFSIEGKPVDVWPVDPTTELIDDIVLIPRVYGIKGTLIYTTEPVENYMWTSKKHADDLMTFNVDD